MEKNKIIAIGILITGAAVAGGIWYYYGKKQKSIIPAPIDTEKEQPIAGNGISTTIMVDNTPVVIRETTGSGKRNAGIVQKAVITGMGDIKNLIAQQ